MITEISINEIKDKAVHSDLLQAMCLINQARNIISSAMDEKELQTNGGYARLDEIVTNLNECFCDVGDIVGSTMTYRIDSMMQ